MAHPAPTIVRDVASLRALTAIYRAEARPVALVPTMGALHAGHVSLVTMAQARGARVIVSIFVNPTQFGPSEDFSKYPRTFDSDLAKLAEAGADAVYAPTVEIMYPPGAATIVKVAGPATAGLDDVSRPFHFDGVATIVAKLFTQARPDLAIFGEKDFQQLAVIRRMAADLDLGVEVIGAPTLRDPDGLALSSRNVYLSPSDRAIATRPPPCDAGGGRRDPFGNGRRGGAGDSAHSDPLCRFRARLSGTARCRRSRHAPAR